MSCRSCLTPCLAVDQARLLVEALDFDEGDEAALEHWSAGYTFAGEQNAAAAALLLSTSTDAPVGSSGFIHNVQLLAPWLKYNSEDSCSCTHCMQTTTAAAN
jgi:hypothetical protein